MLLGCCVLEAEGTMAVTGCHCECMVSCQYGPHHEGTMKHSGPCRCPWQHFICKHCWHAPALDSLAMVTPLQCWHVLIWGVLLWGVACLDAQWPMQLAMATFYMQALLACTCLGQPGHGHTLAMMACVAMGCVVLGSGLGVKALVGGGQGTCVDTHLQCWHGLVWCVLA